MAKAIVKCLYCGVQFDRLAEPCVKIKTRYAHEQCAKEHEEKIPQEKKDEEALKDYIKEKFKENANWALINKQLKTYISSGDYTYKGILKTLQYWYDLKHNDISKAKGGLGIIPYVYGQALDYYYNLYLAQQVNEGKDISVITQSREITIRYPERKTKPFKLHNLEDIEEDEE